jgi:OTU domain-containing protein 6
VDADTVQKELENNISTASDTTAASLQCQIQAKKAKNQKKKEKKSDKEQQRIAAVQEMKATAGPSQREQELSAINNRLLPLNMKVKEVLSDGNCLYRAVADQCKPTDKQYVDTSTTCSTNLALVEDETDLDLTDFVTMRKLAGAYIRQHPDSFAPFIGVDVADPEFESYCRRIENVNGAEWGGQLEVRALSECLHRPIHIYEANAPVLKMGEDSVGNESRRVEPIIITYHRHYYALGEHYNSVVRIPASQASI